MPEEQAFCILVKIMFDYGLRDLFKQGFEELHLKLYQLERLMQVTILVGISFILLPDNTSCSGKLLLGVMIFSWFRQNLF